MDKNSLLKLLKDQIQLELVRQLESALPGEFALADNQNQNQGGLEEMAAMKPEILRNLGIGFARAKEGADDNQNQNQGKLEDLMNMKPAALENIRRFCSLRARRSWTTRTKTKARRKLRRGAAASLLSFLPAIA